MKFSEVVSRITGFSIPIFGVQWNPPEADCVVARRVITFLEDRRVLYAPSEMEMPHHCLHSVLHIREFITGELQNLDAGNDVAQHLRAMRAACRKFLATVGAEDDDIIRHGAERGHYASWIFNSAVGELRGVFGVHISALAASHGLDVEDDLASILPSPE
jgi:hypothetical protein